MDPTISTLFIPAAPNSSDPLGIYAHLAAKVELVVRCHAHTSRDEWGKAVDAKLAELRVRLMETLP